MTKDVEEEEYDETRDNCKLCKKNFDNNIAENEIQNELSAKSDFKLESSKATVNGKS